MFNLLNISFTLLDLCLQVMKIFLIKLTLLEMKMRLILENFTRKFSALIECSVVLNYRTQSQLRHSTLQTLLTSKLIIIQSLLSWDKKLRTKFYMENLAILSQRSNIFFWNVIKMIIKITWFFIFRINCFIRILRMSPIFYLEYF